MLLYFTIFYDISLYISYHYIFLNLTLCYFIFLLINPIAEIELFDGLLNSAERDRFFDSLLAKFSLRVPLVIRWIYIDPVRSSAPQSSLLVY